MDNGPSWTKVPRVDDASGDPIGPITLIPASMLRPNVLVCFGENRHDWWDASYAAGARPDFRHTYRGVHAMCSVEGISVLAPWGSAAVEAVLWELMREPPSMVALWGTAGALPGYQGPQTAAIDPAEAFVVAGFADGDSAGPNMDHDMPTVAGLTTDRFYGGGKRLPDEVLRRDSVIDMESFSFYAYMQRFAPNVECVAVRSVSNPVGEPSAMPENAPDALGRAIGLLLRVG